MAFSVWVTSIVGFVRAHPRRVAAAVGVFAALLGAAWWLGIPRSTPALSQAERTDAAPRARDYQGPFTARLKIQSLVRAQGDDEFELCGYGTVRVVDGEPDILKQIQADIEAAAASASHRIAGDLAAGSTDRDRALGMYLQLAEASKAAGETWVREHGTCADNDSACLGAVFDAGSAATVASRRPLVRLATTTSDPEAYALAMNSCRLWDSHSIGDCALLSSAQWARIEPDNAVPWLYLAAEAQQRHDDSGFEAALNRASQARYSDLHMSPISRFLASDAFEDQPPLIQPLLAVTLLVRESAQSAVSIPNFQMLTQYCRTTTPADPRFGTCSNLAALLVEHSRTLIEVAIGGKIAELTGSTDPRLLALRDEADALRWESQLPKSPKDYVVSSCESLQRFRRDSGIRAESGEAGLVRGKLAESGLTTSQAAQRWRAEIQKRMRQPDGVEPTR